jgi:hypothetical protein
MPETIDNNTQALETTTLSGEQTSSYQQALWKAFEDLKQVQRQQHELTLKTSQLKKTIDALFPIVYPIAPEDINSMSLANAIRLIIASTDSGVSAKEIRNRLRDLGYDLTKYNNPLASIMTAANRMVEAEELILSDDEDEKKLSAGPELKPVPDATTQDNVAAMEQKAGQNK